MRGFNEPNEKLLTEFLKSLTPQSTECKITPLYECEDEDGVIELYLEAYYFDNLYHTTIYRRYPNYKELGETEWEELEDNTLGSIEAVISYVKEFMEEIESDEDDEDFQFMSENIKLNTNDLIKFLETLSPDDTESKMFRLAQYNDDESVGRIELYLEACFYGKIYSITIYNKFCTQNDDEGELEILEHNALTDIESVVEYVKDFIDELERG